MSETRSISVMTILGIVNGVLGVAHSAILAYYFGTTREIEIYFAALTVIGIVGEISQASLLAEIFLPIYHTLKHEHGKKTAFGAFSVIINWLFIGFGILSVLIWFFSYNILQFVVPGFITSDHLIGAWLLRALIPMVFLTIISSFLVVILNAEKQFGKPETAIAISYFVKVIIIIILAQWLGVWALVISMTLWVLTQVVICGTLLHRLGYRHRLIIRQDGFQTKRFFKHIFSLGTSVLSSQVFFITVNAMLSQLPQGTYGVFKYVQNLYGILSAIILKPINKVFFTSFSLAWSEGKTKIRNLIESALGSTLCLVVITNVVFLVAGRNLVNALWASAIFQQTEIQLAVLFLDYFIIFLYIEGWYLTYFRMILTLGLSNLFFIILIISRLSSALILWLCVPKWGVAGIIFGYFYLEITQVLLIWYIIKRKRSDFLVFYSWSALIKWVPAGLMVVALGWFVDSIIPHTSFLISRMGNLLIGSTLATVSLISILAVGWVLKIKEIRTFFSKVRQQLNLHFSKRIS